VVYSFNDSAATVPTPYSPSQTPLVYSGGVFPSIAGNGTIWENDDGQEDVAR
jgi:hypothetical protein